jgi:D-alanyl-lipoteichoic acid acyltransferase DltB (MBOAT superfamily)
LLFASLFFYAWGEPYFVLVMLLSITANYSFALLVYKVKDRNEFYAKVFVFFMLVFNLCIFFVFKYLGFFITTINSIFHVELYVPQIRLPIGISFFTFQAMSYVFDVYRNKTEIQKNLLYVGLYISLFPQLVAGPIVRYQTVANQILHRNESIDDFSKGVVRFARGFCKKMLLSNTLAVIADKAFSITEFSEMSMSFAWLGILAYTLQIYYDFSGYSDMAIGLGRMFGFHFEENFNFPYTAKSVTDFWRRWHISLGLWFRDYVYFPLGGSRNLPVKRVVFNLFVVWLLTGLWHGANWTFIIWGLYWYLLLVIEKFILPKIMISTPPPPQ